MAMHAQRCLVALLLAATSHAHQTPTRRLSATARASASPPRASSTSSVSPRRRISGRPVDPTLDVGPEAFTLHTSPRLENPASNFATFAAQAATSPRVGRGARFFSEQRSARTRREQALKEELDLARAAAFVFDVSAARDELTTDLGRAPASFELARRLAESHGLRPAELVAKEKEGMRAIERLHSRNARMVRPACPTPIPPSSRPPTLTFPSHPPRPDVPQVSLIVRKYVYSTTLDESDLLQEGNIGLITAMRLYNASRAVRFATFASWHVRGSVLRAIMNAHHTIRLPVRVQQEISAIQKVRPRREDRAWRAGRLTRPPGNPPGAQEYKQLCEQNGPGDDGAPSRLGDGLPPAEQEHYITAVAARLGWKREKVISRLRHHQTAQAISLETPCAGGSDTSRTVLGDLVACQRSIPPNGFHGDVEEVLLRDELRSALDGADVGASCTTAGDHARNSAILRLHYGLEDGVEYTCAQIADMFQMSVSRVYSVIQQELCMLRRLYGAEGSRGAERSDSEERR